MLSERIAELRRKNGLSQEQLAEKLGVSRQAVSKWETGLSTPELDKLRALSRCFQVTIDELTGGPPPRESRESAEEPPPAPAGRAGLALCLGGAAGLLLLGLLSLLLPDAARQVEESSVVTLNGTGILLALCVLLMAAGAALICKRR